LVFSSIKAGFSDRTRRLANWARESYGPSKAVVKKVLRYPQSRETDPLVAEFAAGLARCVGINW
jgi:hypothetical protein